jgi:hypothetical protein
MRYLNLNLKFRSLSLKLNYLQQKTALKSGFTLLKILAY